MPTAEVNDISIHYQQTGNGPVLLFISGGGIQLNAWRGVIECLRDKFSCIAFDNRGVGGTSKPLPPYTIPQMAHDSLGLVRALRVSSVHVVGHSMGGYVAQEMCLTSPKIVEGLTLVGTGARPRAMTIYLMELRKKLVRRLDAETFAEVTASWMFSPFSFLRRAESIERFIESARNATNPQPEYAWDAHCAAAAAFDSRERLKQIAVPATVLVGEDDVLTPIEIGQELANAIPMSNFIIVPNAGHMVLLEEPELVAKTIEESVQV